MNYKECDHGISYRCECSQCDLLWIKAVSLPNIVSSCEKILTNSAARTLPPELISAMSQLILVARQQEGK